MIIHVFELISSTRTSLLEGPIRITTRDTSHALCTSRLGESEHRAHTLYIIANCVKWASVLSLALCPGQRSSYLIPELWFMMSSYGGLYFWIDDEKYFKSISGFRRLGIRLFLMVIWNMEGIFLCNSMPNDGPTIFTLYDHVIFACPKFNRFRNGLRIFMFKCNRAT